MDFKKIILIFVLLSGITIPAFADYDDDKIESMYLQPTLEQNEILFGQSKHTIDAINPTPYSNPKGRAFPGARGANQLILYTPNYGERTGTNEFGTEAIIEGNTVVELSGADSFIPRNGAVISGHGTAKNWISTNLSIGTKVYYDDINGVLSTYTTTRSYVFEAMKKIDEANSMIEYYKRTNYGYDWKVPNEYIKEAQNYMRKGEKNPRQIKQYSQLAIESANSAIKSVVPFRTNEFKGVWLRPTETTASAIANSIQKIKAAGIDNIFIETYFHGRTIFPSKTMEEYGFVTQNENFTGIDPLKIWIEEAHKNNMKVHIWFETFYVGNNPPYSNSKNILAIKPQWGNKTLTGYSSSNPTPSVSEHNGYFLDPSNKEVHEFLEKLLTEIITTYNPDGINLDYIRYPQSISNTPAGNWGYTENARNMFNEMYGTDPINLKSSDPLWYQWGNFRRRQVSDFVKKIGELGNDKGIYVSAVIFPDKSVAYTRKLQDWATWSQNHYVQGFTPLFLTCDYKTLNTQISTVKTHKAPETDLFAGLFVTFMGGSEEDLIRQIHESRKLDVNGVILFDFAHLDNKYVQALAKRVFLATGKNNSKKNSSNGPFKQINWSSPLTTSTQKTENPIQLNQTQNNRFIIHRYDPKFVQHTVTPSPTLTTSKKK